MVVSVCFMLAVRLSDLNSTSVLRFVELQEYLIRNIIKHMGVAGVRFQVNIQQKKLGFYSPSTHEELTGGPAPHCHWLVIWGGRKGSLVIMWLNAHLKVPPCTLFIVWVEVRQVGQCSRCTGRWAGVSLPVGRFRVFQLFADRCLRLQPDRVSSWLSYQLWIWRHVIKCEQVLSLWAAGIWTWHHNMCSVAMEYDLRNLCGCMKHNFRVNMN